MAPTTGDVTELPTTTAGDLRPADPFLEVTETQRRLWAQVRQVCLPSQMVERANRFRRLGDWRSACAAAGLRVVFDAERSAAELDPSALRRLAADLADLAPDLLRWNLPRSLPFGLIEPGLTIPLARYGEPGPNQTVLAVRTPPMGRQRGQDLELVLVADGRLRRGAGARRYPFDRWSHLWRAGRASRLRVLAGGTARRAPFLDRWGRPVGSGSALGLEAVPELERRWWDEDCQALRAELAPLCPPGHQVSWPRLLDLIRTRTGAPTGDFEVRLELEPGYEVLLLCRFGEFIAVQPRPGPRPRVALTEALLPIDLVLLGHGVLSPAELHPLVAAALAPWAGREPEDGRPVRPGPPILLRTLDCHGRRHRIGLVDDLPTILDHEPAELGPEHLLTEFGGRVVPCVSALRELTSPTARRRRVELLLVHGDLARARAEVERLRVPGDEPWESILARHRESLDHGRCHLIGPIRFSPRESERDSQIRNKTQRLSKSARKWSAFGAYPTSQKW